MCNRCTLTCLTALLLAVALHTDDASTTHHRCQQFTPNVNTSAARSWRRTVGQMNDSANNTPSPTGHMATTTSSAPDYGEEDVVFSVAARADTSGKEVITVNLNINDYIKLLTCMGSSNVNICTLSTDSTPGTQSVSESFPRFEHISRSFTCGYNQTVQILHCSKLNESSFESLGVFHLYDVHQSNGTNVSINLKWDADQEVISINWSDFLDIRFTCLADVAGQDEQEESPLPYNIAGSVMAAVVIALFAATVWQSVRKRRRHEEMMKSSSRTEDEIEKEKNANSRTHLAQEDNKGFELEEYRIDVRL
ncbi:hypothetical protein Btru_051189 [Bulinus truncatus]|nr:hypothetical protein Btru_051189 [Bulinus truncatus]